MCTGLEIAALAGTAISAGASIDAANERSRQADQEAANERDAAHVQAENIMRARRKQVAAARAAMAGSGTKVDEFSAINTDEIERLGESDAMMSLLTGERRGRSLTYSNQADEQAAKMNAIGSMLSTGYQAGWKGRKGGGY